MSDDQRRELAAQLRREAKLPNPMRGYITQREWAAICRRRAALTDPEVWGR